MTPWPAKSMYRVACTCKEASCIIGHLFGELEPLCEHCADMPDDKVTLMTENGLFLLGKELTIEGTSAFSGKRERVKLTEYGFEFEGNIEEVTQIRKARCLYYGTVHTSKEG